MGSGYGLGQPYGYGLTEQSTIRGNKPAAGAGYSLSLQRYDRWRLIGVAFKLVVDATDNARYAAIAYPGGDTVLDILDLTGVKQAKSTTVTYYGGIHLTPLVTDEAAPRANFRLSGLWLEAGRTVSITVGGIAPADQMSDIRLTFDRFPGGGQVPAESDLPL